MRPKNIFISFLVFVMFLQTVFNLPVDAQDLKTDKTDSDKSDKSNKSDKSDKSDRLNKTGRLELSDMDRVVELADKATDRFARFLFPSSSSSTSGGASDIFSSISSMAGGMNLLNLKLDQDAIVKVNFFP
jgi:hypothetical protein